MAVAGNARKSAGERNKRNAMKDLNANAKEVKMSIFFFLNFQYDDDHDTDKRRKKRETAIEKLINEMDSDESKSGDEDDDGECDKDQEGVCLPEMDEKKVAEVPKCSDKIQCKCNEVGCKDSFSVVRPKKYWFYRLQ